MRFSYILFSVFLIGYGLAAPVSVPSLPTDISEPSFPSVNPRSPVHIPVVGEVVKVAPQHVTGLPLLTNADGTVKKVRFSILRRRFPLFL
jgi:hypothetical protein